jgi:hypothetical protein
MRPVFAFAGCLAMVAVTVVNAQTATPAAPPAAQAPLGMAGQLQGQYGLIKSNLIKLADKMPADAYAYKPTDAVRTFAAGVAHTAATNFAMCANLVGKPNPMAGTDLEKTLADKTGLVRTLRESFTFCDEFMTTLSPAAMTGTYTATAVRGADRTSIQVERGGLAANLIGHNDEMYGYLSVYLRMKGLVPPSSEPRGPGRGGR